MKTEYTTEDWEKLHEEFFSLAREITDIRLHGKLLSMFIKAFNVGLGLGFEEGMNFERLNQIAEHFGTQSKKFKFNLGDPICKPEGYAFNGFVVAIFTTTKGQTRVVAEMENNGMLHIFSEKQLELRNPFFSEPINTDDVKR